jgi:hypothetical protein
LHRSDGVDRFLRADGGTNNKEKQNKEKQNKENKMERLAYDANAPDSMRIGR